MRGYHVSACAHSNHPTPTPAPRVTHRTSRHLMACGFTRPASLTPGGGTHTRCVTLASSVSMSARAQLESTG